MMLTGRIFSAQDAKRARLVQYVVPPGGALARLKKLARRIAENPMTTNDRCDGSDVTGLQAQQLKSGRSIQLHRTQRLS
jgi:enoyl-CoA hydratase/carnithine racemase